MKPSKKISKNKTQKPLEYKPTIEDVLRNQINLYQYCNDLSNKVRDMEVHMQHVDFQSQMIRRDNQDLKSLLNNLGNHLKNMHDREGGVPLEPPSVPMEGSKEEVQPMVKKALPLHDDVMTSCEVCGCNHHLNSLRCPQCGYERARG